jgi:hypothetical protein
MLEHRNTPSPKPEFIVQHFKDAGFVDIHMREKFMDIGDWRGGTSI